jgi:hypothetical protein
MITKGGLWTKTLTGDDVAVMVYDGTNDVEIAKMQGGNLIINNENVYTKDEVNALQDVQDAEIDKKANKDDVYTKDETYTKDEVYTKSETYTKTEVNTELAKKANTGVSYTKAEADAKYKLISDTVVFSAGMTATSVNHGDKAYTKMPFNKAYVDTASAFNTSSNRFVAPITGLYQINVMGACHHGGGGLRTFHIHLYFNGSSYVRTTDSPKGGGSSSGNASTMTATISTILPMNKGQYVEGFSYINADDATDLTLYNSSGRICRFSGSLIAAKTRGYTRDGEDDYTQEEQWGDIDPNEPLNDED